MGEVILLLIGLFGKGDTRRSAMKAKESGFAES
jgi:hypothetical protein